jgi:hypothetical protein
MCLDSSNLTGTILIKSGSNLSSFDKGNTELKLHALVVRVLNIFELIKRMNGLSFKVRK